MSVALGREPVVPSAAEQPRLKKLDSLLKKHQARLVGPDGQPMILPDSVSELLARVVNALARGQAVTVMPIQAELTTQQAAELLNVSRPFLVKLLESGQLSYHLVGTHRRVLVEDLLEYKRRRGRERRQAIDELARLSQEMGLYE